jgi:hypothetical protein
MTNEESRCDALCQVQAALALVALGEAELRQAEERK